MNEDEMRRMAKKIRDSDPLLIEWVVHIARMNRRYYEELVRNGFEHEDAMVLVIEHGMTLRPDTGGDM